MRERPGERVLLNIEPKPRGDMVQILGAGGMTGGGGRVSSRGSRGRGEAYVTGGGGHVKRPRDEQMDELECVGGRQEEEVRGPWCIDWHTPAAVK